MFALLPVFARDVFDTGPWGLGLLRASPGVGALIAAIVLTHWQPRQRVGKIIFGAVAIYGAAIVVFALSQSFVLSMAALATLGMSDMVSVVIRMTLIQLHTPDETRGRISAVNSLFVIASNQLGEFRAGVMAAWLGAIPAVLIGGIGALLVVLVGRKVFSELYRVDTLRAAAALSARAWRLRGLRLEPVIEESDRARPGRRDRAPAGPRNARRAAARPASPCAAWPRVVQRHIMAWVTSMWNCSAKAAPP